MIDNSGLKFIAALFLISALCFLPAESKVLKGKVLYRVVLKDDPAKSIVIKQNGRFLEFTLAGFSTPISLKVDGGGAETCRTILKHTSDKANILLSLPIPTPNMPCQMTAGFVSIDSQTYKISLSEAEIKKTFGNDGELRKIVNKNFGKI